MVGVAGLPWWGVLVVGTSVLRVCLTLPGQVTAQKVASKRINLYREMDQNLIPALRLAVSRSGQTTEFQNWQFGQAFLTMFTVSEN